MAQARDYNVYFTLQEYVPDIRTAVKANLTQLSGALLAKHLISSENDVKLRDRAQNEEDRAADLVTLVMDQVKLNPDNYKTFVDILKESGPHFRHIIQRLPRPLDLLPRSTRGGDQEGTSVQVINIHDPDSLASQTSTEQQENKSNKRSIQAEATSDAKRMKPTSNLQDQERVQGTTLLGPSATTIGSAHQPVQAPSRVATVITAGIPGSGKSTLVHNLLQLRGRSTPQAAGLAPSSATRTTKVYPGEIKGRNVELIEVKLPVSDEKGVQALTTELKSTTGGRVDVLLYCVSMSPNTKIERGDQNEKIIQALTMSFGRGVWDRAILVLTFADMVKMLSVQGKGNSVGKTMNRYAKGFQEMLRSTNCFLKNYTVVACTSPEQNASSEPNCLHKIVAIPAGCKPKEVLIGDTPWDESISIETLNKL